VFTGGYYPSGDPNPPPYAYYDGFFVATKKGCHPQSKIAHPGPGDPPTNHYAMISGDWTICADTNRTGQSTGGNWTSSRSPSARRRP
jgi:hypothetical protein